MNKALLFALALAACSKQAKPLPVIESFTVDDAMPETDQPVQFSYSVTGATRGVAIYPLPGVVTGSPVTVVPPGSIVFTLQASNENGTASKDLPLNIHQAAPLAIAATDANPGQVVPGGAVTLSWNIIGAGRVAVNDGPTVIAADAPLTGSIVVHPVATTSYTLTAYNKFGRTPDAITAPITARVLSPPSAGAFVASPASIVQGDSSTLSWTGNATSYTVSDGTTSFAVGPRRSLRVSPSATTTYTLHASALGRDLPTPLTATVAVDPYPGSSLSYTAPGGAALQLVADACNTPCTSVTLRIKASAAVALRGAALDLPLDATKVSFDPSSFSASLPGGVARATMGSGPLQEVLVVGIALQGSGTAPAPDATLNPGDELAAFSLTLRPAGGRGVVFDGFALAAGSAVAYKASIQRASGRAGNAIAVGKLEAQ
jgi:hypothetical protein